jgi:hypothetical protein
MPRKIKDKNAICKNVEYDSKNDMLIWELHFIHNKSDVKIASPAKSFLEASNINGKVSENDWEYFCNLMKNKKINFVLPEDKNGEQTKKT